MTQQSPNRIIIREYDSLTIGPFWNAERKMISTQQARVIDQYQRKKGIQLFDLKLSSIRATQWVGSFGIGRFCIDVVPKIDRPDIGKSRTGAMQNLLFMLAAADLLPVSPSSIAQMSDSGKPLIVALMDHYLRELTQEWSRGRILQYVRIAENRPYLRGKLLFQDQVRENTVHKERFYTASDEFIPDNPVSRLLKAGIRICEKQRMSEKVSRRAKKLAELFFEVEDVTPQSIQLDRIRVNRPIARFEPLVNLAKLLLSETSAESLPCGDPAYALMFDMNVVFERFIGLEFKRSLAGSDFLVRLQVFGESLLTRDGKRVFHLKPDIGVLKGSEVLCLLDTKWKSLDKTKPNDNVSAADIYQMYAYGKQYAAPLVILVYPRTEDLPAQVAEYRHFVKKPHEDQIIRVATVDVSRPLGKPTAKQALRESLRSLIEPVCGDN
jgi:5-methylcytosine-specific restriction enzyme subunit McrC